MLVILLRSSDNGKFHSRFDPIYIQPIGRSWGRLESVEQWISEGNDGSVWPGKGKFVTISVDKTLGDLQYLVEEDMFLRVSRNGKDETTVIHNVSVRARKHTINLDLLPLSVTDLLKINNGGTIALSVADFDIAVSVKQNDVTLKNKVFAAIKDRDNSAVDIT